jgi:YTH domain-containing family protein
MQAQAAAVAAATQSPSTPQNGSHSPPLQQQQPFNLTTQNSLAFSQLQLQQMNPLMSMQMNLPFVNPQTMQSLMRNPSPAPNPGFAGGIPGFHS